MHNVPPSQQHYHRLQFANRRDTAAFVAALARVLNGPVGRGFSPAADALEVWSCAVPDGGGLEVFLSDAALTAAHTAFAPIPVLDTCLSAALSAACRLVIAGDCVPAWGVDEAERVL